MKFKKTILLSILLFFIVNTANAQFNPFLQPAQYVGIPSDHLNYVVSSQRTPMWCWAACIEMVLKYHKVDITQEDIVTRTFGTNWMGNPPPFGATIDIITRNLNNLSVDRKGLKYFVQAQVLPSMMQDEEFLNELNLQKPIIIAYGPTINSGHVVVLTAASFIQTPQGSKIKTFVVRDPYPTEQTIQTCGKIEYNNFALPQNGGLPAPIQAVWFVDVIQQ